MTPDEFITLRLKLGLNQREMGEKLGIRRSAVAKIEAGRNLMSKPVELLAKKLVEELEQANSALFPSA